MSTASLNPHSTHFSKGLCPSDPPLLKTSEGLPLSWEANVVVDYYINAASIPASLSLPQVQVTLQRAFDTWGKTGIPVRFRYAGTSNGTSVSDDGRNVVTFLSQEGMKRVFGEEGKDALAMTRHWATVTGYKIWTSYARIDGFDMALSADLHWSIADHPRFTEADLLNILVHEIGHVYGFDHSEIAESTMFSTAPLGETGKRDLSATDLCYIKQLKQDLYSPSPLLSGLHFLFSYLAH